MKQTTYKNADNQDVTLYTTQNGAVTYIAETGDLSVYFRNVHGDLSFACGANSLEGALSLIQ